MKKVLVFCEFNNGKVKKGALELLSAAKTAGSEITAVAIGEGSKGLSDELCSYGAKEVYVCDNSALSNYNPLAYTELLVGAINKAQPDILLASSSALGKDLFPRVGARLSTGVISDCTELKIDGDNLVVRRPMYSAKCSAEVNFSNSPTKIVLMKANQLPVNAPESGASGTVHELEAPSTDLATIIKDVVKGASERLDITEANVVVSGGRGMKDAEGFKLLEDLADVVGGSVGASRAVVDAGWVSHSMQVGQTGKAVAPTLYFACGISGAIQHLAGMSSSKVIVAINKDPEAPIFQKATYGIVGDVFEVLPKLTEELKSLLA